ncbi:MAG: methionine biosynthesis protein MetW [Hyphomonadaceae bacterium]
MQNAPASRLNQGVLELAPTPLRADHAVIVSMVRDGARVLDVGCSDGALLTLLTRERGAQSRGLDIDAAAVTSCVAKGLAAVQGDADRDLALFPDRSYDVVVFANTLQHLRRPRQALKHAARIADAVIVSIANYGHLSARMGLFTGGRFAAPPHLRARWCDSDIAHPCSVRDLADLARETGLRLECGVPISGGQSGAPFAKTLWRANWLAEEVVFLLSA